MNYWNYLWLALVLFSVISFGYMSFKIVIKGIAELKLMFKDLNE